MGFYLSNTSVVCFSEQQYKHVESWWAQEEFYKY